MWAVCIVAGTLLAICWRWRRSGLGWFDFVILHGARVYTRLWHRWSCNRPWELPRSGPALIIANHTCSADPTFLLAASPRPISFLVAQEHYNLPPLNRWVLDNLQCVSVIRNGQDPVALRKAFRRLEKGLAVCLFPEGNLSSVARDRLAPGKHGAAFLALHSRVPIYPVYISGGPRTEQLLKSWLLPTPRAVRVVFGKPVDLSAFYGQPITRRLIAQVTDLLMEHIRTLR